MVKEDILKPRVQQPVDLSWIETKCYIFIWITSCFYAIYQVFVYSSNEGGNLNSATFDQGWSILGRKRDKSDFEWQYWRGMISQRWPVYLGHILLGQIFRRWKYDARHWVFSLYGCFAAGVCITFKVVIYQVLVCLITAGTAYLSRSVIILWLVGLAHLYTVQDIHRNPDGQIASFTEWMCDGDENKIPMMIFSTCYLFMRYISFSHDLINHLRSDVNVITPAPAAQMPHKSHTRRQGLSAEKQSRKKPQQQQTKTYSVVQYLSYVFYFPIYFTGPIYTYDRFCNEMNVSLKPWTKQSVLSLVKDSLRVTFWTLFMDVWLHYSFFYSIQHHHYLMWEIPYWTLAGIGYQVGQFFMVKYVSIFGIPANIAKLDGLTPPSTPRCGGWIYKYSDMWRTFDKGLHSFMTRHVYFPLGGSKYGITRQLFATMMCYWFVFFWHGGTMSLFVWAGLNFVEIVIEAIANLISKWPTFIKLEDRFVPPRWGRRLRALFWTPVLMMNFLSSFTLFAGGEVGKIYAYRFLIEGFPVTHLTVGFAFYSFVQTSMEYSNYLERKKLKME